MSARLLAVAVLLIVPLALRASPSKQAGEPAADGHVEWKPQEAVAAILRSDLTVPQKAAALARFVRIGDDPMVVLRRLGCTQTSTLQIKPNSRGTIYTSSGLMIEYLNGEVEYIWTHIPGRKDEVIIDAR